MRFTFEILNLFHLFCDHYFFPGRHYVAIPLDNMYWLRSEKKQNKDGTQGKSLVKRPADVVMMENILSSPSGASRAPLLLCLMPQAPVHDMEFIQGLRK